MKRFILCLIILFSLFTNVVLAQEPTPSTAWGATGATEPRVRTFLQDWTCYLADTTPNGTNCITSPGGEEKISLEAGQYAESPTMYIGLGKEIALEYNKYATGTNVILKYRTGATSDLSGVSWSTCATPCLPFWSLGYVQLRVEK